MRIALACVLTALAAPASANCTPGQQDAELAWPADHATNVATNARILVQRFGTDAFRERPARYELTPDGGAPIPLRVVEDLRSGSGIMHQRTLVLAPAAPLAAGTRYTFVLQQIGYTQSPSFTTGAGPDASPPSVRSIRPRAFERMEMGCGPADSIPIDVDAEDPSGLWVRLRIARTAGDLAARRYVGEMILVPFQGRVDFGHGMCVGNWGLERGQQLVARASVLDPAGHEIEGGTIVLDGR